MATTDPDERSRYHSPTPGQPIVRKIRAGFVTDGDPRSAATWSGTPLAMLQALERHFDMVCVVSKPWPRWYRWLGRGLKLLTLRRFQYTASRAFTRTAAAGAIRQLADADLDVVLAVSVSPMAHALTERFRVVYVADATVSSMLGYYDAFTTSTGGGAAGADRIEALTIRGAMLSLFPSAWARDSAMADYGVAPERALEIAWGANLPAVDPAPRTLGSGPVRLLFVGAEWDRKGGPLALAIVAEAQARGIDCRLDVVGNSAAVLGDGAIPAGVTFHGYLAKQRPDDARRIEALFDQAALFLLPTRAECYGIVFAEAASRALPSISTATGGVPSVVRHGETGLLLPPGASASDFAREISGLVGDPARYAAMSRAALADSRDRLDWNVWAEGVEAAVRQAMRRAA